MTRTQYRAARRLIRDNGVFALRWLQAAEREAMTKLAWRTAATDPLAERVWILRAFPHSTPRQTTWLVP